MKKIYLYFIVFISLIIVSCSKPSVTPPNISTNTITNITSNSATLGGNVIDAEGSEIVSYGVCWSLNTNPVISMDNVSNYASISGNFSFDVDDFSPNTKYYVRAFATTNEGTSYGDNISFTTTNFVTESEAVDIFPKSATLQGNQLSTTGFSTSSMGFCYNTLPNPTLSNYYVDRSSNGPGIFSEEISNLQSNTTYYVRPYYTISGTTYYDNQFTFKTTGFFGASSGYVVFDRGKYVSGSPWRYIETAPNFIVFTEKWGCYNSYIGFTGTAIGQGWGNTASIVEGCSSSSCAARLCNNYSVNGLSDWFLPSLDETKIVLKARYQLIGFQSGNGIWSSSESTSTSASNVYCNSLGVLSVTAYTKDNTEDICPIRSY